MITMNTINWDKIDKYYIVLVLTLIIMALLVIYTFRGIFSSFLLAYELSPDVLSSNELKIDSAKLEEAHSFIYQKTPVPLNIKD